ncbi:MAG: DegV family protein [Lachnospiraceae bacterium]|nr:DegV family protein [Lachnospiraceae bacterium]
MNYQIVSDATADISPEMLEGLPTVRFIPMNITVGDEPYLYGEGGEITTDEFYEKQNAGKFASTSQIIPNAYEQYFDEILREGQDILYLGFSSGLSNCYQNSLIAAEALREKYPERTLRCVDTLCASVGGGFLVREAARKQAEGASLEELGDWVEERKLQVCHWFTVDNFEHLRHGGRVSATTAVAGTMLNIKPLLIVDNEGKLQTKEKPRGRKRAMKAQLARMQATWQPEISPLVVIGEGDAKERAAELAALVKQEFPQAEIFTAPVGPVIGAHTGPGMLALIFWGSER